MIDRFLLWLMRNVRRKYIGWDGDLYLTRFYLGKIGRWEFHLHRFTRGDADRRVHDHPYEKSYSFILYGGYEEERMIGVDPYNGPITKLRRKRWFNSISALDFHRVTRLLKPVVWTLFVHTPKIKEWGFLEQRSALHSRETKYGTEHIWRSSWVHDPFVQDDERHYVALDGRSKVLPDIQ